MDTQENLSEGTALELERPHGWLIWRGKQTAIGNDEPLPVGEPLMIVSGGEAYGLVTLTEPAVMTVKRFDDQEEQEQHCVRDNERRLWWPEAEQLYVHRFKEWQPLEKSTLAEVKDGGVVFRQPDRLSQQEKELVGVSKTLPKQISLDRLEVVLNTKDPSQVSAPSNMPSELKTALTRVLKSTFQQDIEFVTKAQFDHIPLYELALLRSPRLEVKRFGGQADEEEGADVSEAEAEHEPEDDDEEGETEEREWQSGIEEKRRWTRKFINDLPDSHFIYVETGGELDSERKTKPRRLRHFPYKGSNGQVDLIHLRNAIARMPLANDKNGDRLSDSLVERLQGEARELLKRENEKAVETVGTLAAEAVTETKAGRRLRKSWVEKFKDFRATLGEFLGWAEYQDIDQSKAFSLGEKALVEFDAGFTLKEVGGEIWYFAWATNAFEDRQAETFSTRSLEQYVEESARNQDKGFFNFWHIPGTDFARKEWQAVIGRFLVEAGPFLDNHAGRSAKEFFGKHSGGHPDFAPEGWGSSPEYRFLPEERETQTYKWIWITRTTTLPRAAAANVWTQAGQEVNMALEGQQKDAAIALFGKEFVKNLIDDGEARTDDLEKAGVAFKQQIGAGQDTKQAEKFAKALRKLAEDLEDGKIKEQILEVAGKLTEENLAENGKELQALREEIENEEVQAQLADIAEQMLDQEKEAEADPVEEGVSEQQTFTLEQIVEALSKEMQTDFSPLAEAMASLAVDMGSMSSRLETIEKTQTLKQNTELPRFIVSAAKRASEAKKTVVTEDDPLTKMKPHETQDRTGNEIVDMVFGG